MIFPSFPIINSANFVDLEILIKINHCKKYSFLPKGSVSPSSEREIHFIVKKTVWKSQQHLMIYFLKKKFSREK